MSMIIRGRCRVCNGTMGSCTCGANEMNDIIERLRVRKLPYGYLALMDEAADEIERLHKQHDIEVKEFQTENEWLRTALATAQAKMKAAT